MVTWIRRHRLVTALGAAVVVGLAGVAAFAFAGGFDDTTTTRVSGRGAQVVRVALVDRAVGYDVTPDVLEVEEGTHVVLEVANEGEVPHNLAIEDGGPRTRDLDPGETERLDLGVVSADRSGRCTIGDHDIAGMTIDLDVV
jgi:nitrite reductase (NO-forming)